MVFSKIKVAHDKVTAPCSRRLVFSSTASQWEGFHPLAPAIHLFRRLQALLERAQQSLAANAALQAQGLSYGF